MRWISLYKESNGIDFSGSNRRRLINFAKLIEAAIQQAGEQALMLEKERVKTEGHANDSQKQRTNL